jgi:serine/threonine protein kinase
MLSALRHCNEKKIAHRDIKPENIMITKDGEVKLIDFGLSKQNKSKYSNKLTTMVGTPYFVAPEVLEGNYSYACDVWSLGVLLYLILSGELPFDGDKPVDVFE